MAHAGEHEDAVADVVGGAGAAVTAWRKHLMTGKAAPAIINQALAAALQYTQAGLRISVKRGPGGPAASAAGSGASRPVRRERERLRGDGEGNRPVARFEVEQVSFLYAGPAVNLTEGDAVSAALVAGPDHCCAFSGGQWQAESGVLRAGSCRQLGACAADAGPQGRASALQARGVAGRRPGRPRRKR